MSTFILAFILIPLLGYLLNLVLPARREPLISRAAQLTVLIQLNTAIGFLLYWLFHGAPVLDARELRLYEDGEHHVYIDLYFDKIGAVYLIVGALLTFLVAEYSRTYMHREAGFKRFFNTILFFYLGYNLAILAGNLETLFIGWEVLGISSFLLIVFYRDRYLPVKNAVKVFSIYRIGDVGLLLAIWMSHHLWHDNVTFQHLNQAELVSQHLEHHTLVGVFVSVMLLVTAAAKSAQLPFSSWLPRAMEGPTPSSAIFYGSLSVHMGVFLLLRTRPFWEHQPTVRIAIVLLGAATALIATGIARVQSSVKSQVAYASIAQIGLMFIELGLGFEDLVLVHFAGNAFLRTYQLLVSPSVVSYLIREQFYHFTPSNQSLEDRLPARLRYSLYLLCIKEWNLDSMMYRYLWIPLKWAGSKLNFLNLRRVILIFAPAYGIALLLYFNRSGIPPQIAAYLPVFFAFLALVTVLKSFSERLLLRMSWMLILMNHLWIALAISFNEEFPFTHILLYLSGVVAASGIGLLCLNWMKAHERSITLNRFQGQAYEHPRAALIFLLCCLGMTGFPLTPTFIGEDLMFGHIHANQVVLASCVALSFILSGLSSIRIYARVFLGPHVKTYHEVAYRSS
ncbi:MAG: proton-conducting transporter membrane subunit [Bacteroidia bacterium]|nr:proton-conducting transporter membrane subunit [Bacteroidia bacterium]